MANRLPLPALWVGIAFIPRLAYLFEQGTASVLFHQPMLDEQELAATALALLEGAGFGPEPLFKAPLYPLILATVIAFFGNAWLWGIRLLQHACGALLAAIAYDSARILVGRGRCGTIASSVAAFLIAFHAPLIRLEDRILVDFAAVFLQSLMLWSLLRWSAAGASPTARPWIAAAGVAAALAWLNRPTIMVVLPFLLLWIPCMLRGWKSPLRRKRALATAALFIFFPLLAFSAVWVRNASVGDAMLLPWQGGFNLYEANRKGTDGRYLAQRAFAASETGNPTRRIAEEEFLSAVRDGETPAPPEGKYYSALDDWWSQRALAEIRSDVPAWITLMLRKGLDLTSEREIYNFEEFRVQKRFSSVLSLMPLSFGWIWAPACASLTLAFLLPRHRRRLFPLVWLYMLSLAAGIALYYTSGRLRMPLVFPVVLLAACTLALVARGLTRKAQRRPVLLAASVVALLLGFMMSWGNWNDVRTESFDHAEYARMSNAAWRSNRPVLALRYAEESLRAMPGYPPALSTLGQALYSLHRYPEAAAAFERAATAMPADSVSTFNLGILHYYDLNDPRAAADEFAETLRRNPAYADALSMLALSHLRNGDIREAARILDNVDESHITQSDAPLLLLAALAAWHCHENDDRRVSEIHAIARQRGASFAVDFTRELELAGCQN